MLSWKNGINDVDHRQANETRMVLVPGTGHESGEPMRAWIFDSHHGFRAHLMPVHSEQVEKELTLCPGEWAGPMEPPP